MFTYPNKIIAVSCSEICKIPLAQQVPYIAEAGIKRLILREKQLDEADYTRLAEEVLKSCLEYGVELTLHYYPSAAKSLGISRLHMPLAMVTEELCGEFETLGCSVHSAAEAVKAQRLGAAYVMAGHIFATDCKKGLAPRGLDFLREVCAAADIDVYAVGGINESNIKSTLEAGAAGVCIMSEAMKL